MEEQPLEGGFVNEVVRVGDTVRRTAGYWTPAVHALLDHLASVGFAEAPRALGIDERGREVLSFLPGETVGWTDWPEHLKTDEGPVKLGRLLRKYHDAVRTFTPPPDAQWRNVLADPNAELIRHGDFTPFNVTWRGADPVGIIDWDFVQPGKAIHDLAYLAWYLVPLQPDARAEEYGMATPIDRHARLEALCEAYGGDFPPADVVEAAAEVIEQERDHTIELARRGLHPWTKFASDGTTEAFTREASWIRANLARQPG
jgi:hypothetical protein